MPRPPRTAAPAFPIAIDIEVRYAETDAMAVVHHSRYLVWFELARTHLCRLSGYTYSEIERMGWFLVVTRTESTYRDSARYGDTVQLHCRLARLSSRLLRFEYEVRRAGALLVEGATEHVWVERATGRTCRIPAVLDAPFRALLEASPA